MFKDYYNHRFQEIFGSLLQESDGLGDDVVQAKLAEQQIVLPKGLVDYYAIAGQHPINEEHNRLLPIEEIFWIDDKLVFSLHCYWIMTELLQQAIVQIQQLPPDQQDAIAARFLAELQDEQKWETSFAATTDDQWDQMAAMVRQEITKGETVPLAEVFSPQKWSQALPKPFVSG
jgi:hypothetical protein